MNNAKLEVSLDRPHAERVLKSSSEEVSFHEKNGTELSGQAQGSAVEEKKSLHNTHTPDRWPLAKRKKANPTSKPQAERPLKRVAGTAVHSVACLVGAGGVTYAQRNT